MDIRGTAIVRVTPSMASDGPGRGKVLLSVEVSDEMVRKRAPDFNGLEEIFALRPVGDGKWEKVDLKYTGSVRPGGSSRAPLLDRHTATLSVDVGEYAKMAATGVAFGAKTNVGTLWFQSVDQNYKPHT